MSSVSYKQEDLLRLAYIAARESPDPSTQVGAVIWFPHNGGYISACNTFPRGIKAKPHMLDRPAKYDYIEHAERNCVFKLVRKRLTLPDEAVMAGTWMACADCARCIIQSGIKTIIRHASIPRAAHWDESTKRADEMLEIAGVKIIDYEGSVRRAPSIRFNYEIWNPDLLQTTEE